MDTNPYADVCGHRHCVMADSTKACHDQTLNPNNHHKLPIAIANCPLTSQLTPVSSSTTRYNGFLPLAQRQNPQRLLQGRFSPPQRDRGAPRPAPPPSISRDARTASAAPWLDWYGLPNALSLRVIISQTILQGSIMIAC